MPWRRGVLVALLGTTLAAAEGLHARIDLDLTRPGRPLAPGLLGANIQWVDGGDGLLLPGSTTPEPQRRQRVAALAPTSLRYPGGTLASVYHWQRGVGPAAARGLNRHVFTGADQPTWFGTDEFLDLCRQTGAEPLLTVSVLTGTPAEAAAWVRAVNPPGGPPRCTWWELDNEPYLREDLPGAPGLTPAAYVLRAEAVLAALRAVDPTLRIGLPLRSDRIGDVPTTAYPGYAETVLRDLRGTIDFIALHNAYLPVALAPGTPEPDLFAAAMAGYRVVEDDLARTRALVLPHRGRDLPLAITEYGPLFAFSGEPSPASLAGALVVADLLRCFSEQDDVVLAHLWSLCGNGGFGALSPSGRVRPTWLVLQAFRSLLGAPTLPARVTAPTFTSPRVGVVPPQADVPLVAVRAVQHGHRVRLLVVVKSWSAPIHLTVVASRPVTPGAAQVVAGARPFAPADDAPEPEVQTADLRPGPAPGTVQVVLPGPSVALVEVVLP